MALYSWQPLRSPGWLPSSKLSVSSQEQESSGGCRTNNLMLLPSSDISLPLSHAPSEDQARKGREPEMHGEKLVNDHHSGQGDQCLYKYHSRYKDTIRQGPLCYQQLSAAIFKASRPPYLLFLLPRTPVPLPYRALLLIMKVSA